MITSLHLTCDVAFPPSLTPLSHRLSNQSGIMTTSVTHEGQLPFPRSCCDPWSGMSVIDTISLALSSNKQFLPSFHKYPFTLAFLVTVFIFDTGKCLYVWTSRGPSSNETKNGLSYAHVSFSFSTQCQHSSLSPHILPPLQNYLMQTKHPLIPVSCYVQGREPDDFWKVISRES